MTNAEISLVIPRMVRRYVAWTERNVVEQCVEMYLRDLGSWNREQIEIPEIEILPLPQCGPEWLLRRVHNECNRDSPGFRPAGYMHILALRAAPHHDSQGILLARAGRRIVGFCMGRCRSAGRGLINGLAVHPEFRRRGIGRALLRATLAYLQRKGASEAVLRVRRDNEAPLQLYHSEGFCRM